MNNDDKFNLKLMGKNEEDLKVISAYMQDSIVIVKDIVFLKHISINVFLNLNRL